MSSSVTIDLSICPVTIPYVAAHLERGCDTRKIGGKFPQLHAHKWFFLPFLVDFMLIENSEHSTPLHPSLTSYRLYLPVTQKIY
jgi:hypothetical protein